MVTETWEPVAELLKPAAALLYPSDRPREASNKLRRRLDYAAAKGAVRIERRNGARSIERHAFFSWLFRVHPHLPRSLAGEDWRDELTDSLRTVASDLEPFWVVMPPDGHELRASFEAAVSENWKIKRELVSVTVDRDRRKLEQDRSRERLAAAGRKGGKANRMK